LMVIAFSAAPAQAGDDAAEAYVNSLASRAMEILNQPEITPENREAAFRDLFAGNMDIPRIGAFALGQYARTPTPEQKSEYLALVEDFIVKVYANRLSGYENQTFAVTGSQSKGSTGKEVIVASVIEFTNGRDDVPVEWWLLKDGDTFKVFDVKVVGIWMAQEQRSSFISVIRNNNGDFSHLLKHLQTQIQQATNHSDTSVVKTDVAVGG
ncbi:MAG: ABC transporter substrate-binding protein, partial [Parvibaculum sp.]